LKEPYGSIAFSDEMKIMFNFDTEGKEIIILLETSVEGYAAIGFGAATMKGSDIITVLF
jgi:hypothetical protein